MAKREKKAETGTTTQQTVVITPPKMITAIFELEGTSPYVQCRFSEKSEAQIRAKQAAGSTAAKDRKREARDFDRDYEQAKHISTEGWIGMPASAFRNAMISACRLVSFKMTLAKLAVFVEADGYDHVDGMPLVRIQGTPEKNEMMGRLANGSTDIRVRPLWRQWGCQVRVRFDADQFTIQDITNLMARVGMQVGVGEGRPDSRQSAGLGWGMFRIVNV